jgi:hypothetical protein
MSFKCFHNSPTLLPDLIASEKLLALLVLILWQSCLLMDQNEMSNHYRGPSIDASYQVSYHLARRFQRKSCFRNRSIQVYEDVFSSQILELTQLSNFSVDAFKLEFLMMRSATDEKWLLKLLQISSILSHFFWPSGFRGKAVLEIDQ